MLKAFGEAYDREKGLGANSETCERFGMEAALRWWSKNPIVPTDEQMKQLLDLSGLFVSEEHQAAQRGGARFMIGEWQRRMFLAPDRITVVPWLHDPTKWIALRDGWNPGNIPGFKDKKDAEIYADGLRYRLQKEAENSK